MPRRTLLKQGVGAGLCVPFGRAASWLLADAPAQQAAPFTPLAGQLPFSADDDALLEDLEHRNFQFFWEQANPESGLVKDRCNVTIQDKSTLCSIAALGFGLTALCIGAKRGYVSHLEARGRALNTLRFLWRKLPNHRGFFYHWANFDTGERTWDSEVSSIDTGILLCGVLTCRTFFEHSEISELARLIFDRVEWTWLSEDTRLLSHGWTPDTGFLPYRWDNYSEMMMIYLLGLGSATHPLPPDVWDAWKRTIFEYDGIRYIGSFAPLFVHQYSQAWFDFRDKHDAYADYFKNSIIATEVHKRFCLDLAGEFPDYSEDLWGITASDSRDGYVVWGGPPATGPIDGTVVPCAAGGSLPFLPQETVRVLHTVRNKYGNRAWCKYGFVDAFNPLTNWYDTDVVGIDTGITILMAENARTGFVWDTFMKNPEAVRGMQRAGFQS
ncbi:MAG TPA: glucoamylase family protein [Verrucomicrobiae bacterium]|nr:glucoamylase family protein [Verrucomicrobiae bacterium]